MLVAVFLCETAPSGLLENLLPELNEKISLSLTEKFAALDPEFVVTDIFPFWNELSDGIETVEFCRSFLVQPALFLRIRPQARASVVKKMGKHGLPGQLIGEDCLQMTVSDKVEEFFMVDKEVVVQDYNSQKVLDYLKKGGLQNDLKQSKPTTELAVWDCCAASGGKSILLHDILNRNFDLTVSDIRANIVLNLHRRFNKAGIKKYKYFIADISDAGFSPGKFDFDLIICDAPCSGSGTWSRTPEQLCFFKQSSIEEYSNLQKRIVANSLPYLQTGGLFIYITCSVFKSENEEVAKFITENLNCKLLNIQLLKGYDKKADSMFVAAFRKL